MSALTKTIKVPQELTRAGIATFDTEKKTLRLSISSDEPYLRYDRWDDEEYWEVLDHSPTGVDLSRLKKGAALLFNHDRNIMLGKLSEPTLENGRCYVEATISEAPDVESYRVKISEGILKDTSIGYALIDEGECVGAKDGKPIYKFRFAVHEASMVTIPADTSVGVGRQRSHKPEGEPKEIRIRDNSALAKDGETSNTTQQPEHRMAATLEAPATPAQKIDVVKERADAAQEALVAYQAKCDKIDAFIGALPKQEWKDAAREVSQAFKKTGDKRSFDEFRAEALDKCATALRAEDGKSDANIGMSKKDLSRFSLCKCILESYEMRQGRGKGLTGIEKEACDFAAEKYRKDGTRSFEGITIPCDVTEARNDVTFDLNTRGLENIQAEIGQLRRTMMATPFAQGGFLVGTDLLGGSFIDILRNAALIGQGPLAITELTGLTANVLIPKQLTTATVYWLAEGASVTESSMTGGQLALTPHRMGVQTNWTKQLLLQSSISVEMLVRNDQAAVMAIEEDRVIVQGTGLNGEPLGITNTTGVGANITFGGNATWADITNFEYQLENANVRMGPQAFFTTPTTKSYLRATLVVASSTFPIFLWMSAKGEFPDINGVRAGVVGENAAYATKNAPSSNRVLFGVWSNNVIKARWGGLDLVTDPYTGAATETIKTYLNQWIDVGVRYPQAFEYSTDAPTSP